MPFSFLVTGFNLERLQAQLLLLQYRLQVQGRRIHAVTQSSGRRTILKDVAKMGSTMGTARFYASHAMAVIDMFLHILRIDGRPEAGPS